MIFQKEHIEMIRNGLSYIKPSDILYHPMPLRIVKTQTRRLNRGIYWIGRDYAVQRKRGVKAEPDIRIVMDRIWDENGAKRFISQSGRKFVNATEIRISKEDAQAEGGYTPDEYEKLFRELNPRWTGFGRWAFEFHVIEVQK